MVIEYNGSKLSEELKQNTGYPRIEETWMDKTGEDSNGLHLGKFEKRRPTFFQIYISLYQNVIYTAGKSFSVVM